MVRSRKPLLLTVAWIAAAGPSVFGQGNATQIHAPSQAKDTAAKVPGFEVASIRPMKSGNGGISIRFTDDGISYAGVSTQMLLRRAFGVEDDRILGMPGWAKSDRYEIQARVSEMDVSRWEKLSYDQKRVALLPLLTDRFNLKFHHETRVLSVYALVVNKSGPKLHEAKPGDSYLPGINGTDGPVGAPGTSWMHPGKITAQAVPIADLVRLLSILQSDHTIFDKTRLTGKYDLALQWTPDDGPPPMVEGTGGGKPSNDSAPDAFGPSLFTALQEQLGLRLESQKEPVDVIVIDHIEKPSEN
jgi:bla regulator protein blaR1